VKLGSSVVGESLQEKKESSMEEGFHANITPIEGSIAKDNDVFSDDQPVKDKSGWSSEQASKIIEEEELSVKSAKKSEKPAVKSEQESEGYSDDDWNEE
jgi:hypothetical protein